MKKLFLLLALLAPSAVYAQTIVTTGPFDANHRIAWDSNDMATAALQVSNYEPRVYLDGATTFTALPAETCVAKTPADPNMRWTCTSTIPAALLAVLNSPGSHSMILRLADVTNPQAIIESPNSVPFSFRSPAGAPSGPRIIR